MFRSAVGKVIRLGVQSSKRMSSTLICAARSSSNVGYALALGAFGAASIFVIRKQLNAQEEGGGYLYTWGSGQFGQLGIGTQNDESLPQIAKEIDNKICTSVAAGANTTAAITQGGVLWTFGQGDSNQLGHGDTGDCSNQVLPREVEDVFNGLAVVNCSICDGHMAAVTEDGSVWTWGRSTFGRLGHEVHETGIPEKVPGLEGVRFTKVACGHVHTLALTEDGRVFAWGNNKTGCVGVSDRGTCQPQEVESLRGKKIIDISAGMESSAALSSDHEVYTWGADNYGQLGLGQGARYISAPTRIRMLRNVPIVQIACGQYHMLALSASGEVYAWGQGLQGQTANEKKVDTNIPHLIDSLKDNRVKLIAAGGSHSAVVDDKGRLFTFGCGRNGQLGRGDKIESIAAYRVEPTLVEYLQGVKVVQVACGGDHTAAIVDRKV